MEASNMKVARDALSTVKRLFDGQIMFQPSIRKAHEAVNTALVVPPRNCDVGTAEEQYDRWSRFCQYRSAPLSQNRSCFGCPVYDEMHKCKSSCELIWAQMPYEEKEGGNDGK